MSPQTSYAISLMLTHFRYTIAPSYADDLKALKNDVEIDGMRRAYARDGAAFVRLPILLSPLWWIDRFFFFAFIGEIPRLA